MKKIKLILFLVLLLSISVLSLVACKEKVNQTFKIAEASVNVKVGETKILTLEKTNISETVVWSVDNPLRLSLDQESGSITGVSVGVCLVTVKAGSFTDTCTVKVVAADDENTLTPFPVIVLSQEEAEINPGTELSITAEVFIDNVLQNDTVFNWQSSDNSVATVDAVNGAAKIKGVAKGTTSVTVSAQASGEIIEKQIHVSVKTVASLFVDKSSIEVVLAKLNAEDTIETTVAITDASFNNVSYEGPFTYTVSDEFKDIISINIENNDCIISGKKAGKAELEVSFTKEGEKVSTIIYVVVNKANGIINANWRFDYLPDEEINEFILFEDISDLNLVGTYEYLSYAGEIIPAIQSGIGFAYSDIISFIGANGLFGFNIETDKAIYTASAIITNRTGWTSITTLEELSAIRNLATSENSQIIEGKFYLKNDIDCTGLSFFETIYANFNGILDGNYHTVKNLAIKIPAGVSNERGAFIHALYGGGIIKNIAFENLSNSVFDGDTPNYTQKYGFVNYNGGLIENVILKYSGDGGFSFGGIAQTNGTAGKIRNCAIDVSQSVLPGKTVNTAVTAHIVRTNQGTVSNCYANASASNSLGDHKVDTWKLGYCMFETDGTYSDCEMTINDKTAFLSKLQENFNESLYTFAINIL